jgi:predicted TIM-barrel fold metal-dependent hydrolase
MSSQYGAAPPIDTFIPPVERHSDVGPSRRAFLAAMGMAASTTFAQAPKTPTQAIARIVAARRIINVHEHVQGRESTDALLREMDALGIARTVLLGSPWFTISLYEQAGFTRYDENNAAIVAMAQAHPDRFEAWPTVNPLDGDKVEKIRALLGEGASGVKLYLGHGYTATRRNTYIFHPIAMDDPRMMDLYAYLAEMHIPVCYHVNPAKPGFMDEFVTVLRRFPDLKVNTPHFMLSSIVHARLREMFATFPNLVVDISFGHDDYLKTGLQRISANPAAFRKLMEAFPERFLFGTDYVVTALRPHNHDWYAVRTRTYLDMLSKRSYTTRLLPGRTLTGLALAPPLLEKILYRNFETFRASTPQGTTLTREVQWDKLRVPRVQRAPGQALAPPRRRRGRN